jgi:hypothetical protein
VQKLLYSKRTGEEEKGRGGRREKDRQEWISEGIGVPRD